MILIPELQNQNGILILIYSSVNFLRVSTSVSEKLVLKKFLFRNFGLVTLLLSLEFMDWHLQWGNDF